MTAKKIAHFKTQRQLLILGCGTQSGFDHSDTSATQEDTNWIEHG